MWTIVIIAYVQQLFPLALSMIQHKLEELESFNRIFLNLAVEYHKKLYFVPLEEYIFTEIQR